MPDGRPRSTSASAGWPHVGTHVRAAIHIQMGQQGPKKVLSNQHTGQELPPDCGGGLKINSQID